MVREKDNKRVIGIPGHENEQKFQDKGSKQQVSLNETPVPLMDSELAPWIKVVRPSRASLTYDRME